MKIASLSLLTLFSVNVFAANYQISDHSIPSAEVKTFHVKCTNGQFGMVWFDPKGNNEEVCASSQTNSKNKCSRKTDFSIESAATFICE